MATAIRRRSENYRPIANARRTEIPSRLRDAAAIFISDRRIRAGALDHDVDVARIERWFAADDGTARQRFLAMHRAIETERLNQTSAGEHRHHCRRAAPAISRFERERGRED